MGKGKRNRNARTVQNPVKKTEAKNWLKNNPAREKAVLRELEEQVVRWHDNWIAEEWYCIFYALRVSEGFGEKRLRRFYDAYKPAKEALRSKYAEYKSETHLLAKQVLNGDGIDIDSWGVSV